MRKAMRIFMKFLCRLYVVGEYRMVLIDEKQNTLALVYFFKQTIIQIIFEVC